MATSLRVKFVTKDAALRIPGAPIDVPLALSRIDLSEIVNHLLGPGHSRKDFEFLAVDDAVLLQTSLAEHLAAVGKTAESILVLEYFVRVEKPEEHSSDDHPDWVSAVDASLVGHIVTGCYDGAVRVYDDEGRAAAAPATNHEAPIKAVAGYRSPSGISIVSVSKDRTLCVWNLASGSLVPTAVGHGHGDSIESVAVADDGMVASGGWDGAICLWRLPTSDKSGEEKDNEEAGEDGPMTKRRRTTEMSDGSASSTSGGTLDLSPFASLMGHAQCVTDVTWVNDAKVAARIAADCAKVLVSGSWDHSIRIWDVARLCCVRTVHCNKVVTALAVSPRGLIASAHPDRAVRVWDVRNVAEGENVVARAVLRGHAGWVSDLAFQPRLSDASLVSVSYDKSVCLWDVRGLGKTDGDKENKDGAEAAGKCSAKAVHKLGNVHDDKILCVGWRGEDCIVTGGADSKMKRLVLGGKKA
jgi:ribosome biogenesis protein YTM1